MRMYHFATVAFVLFFVVHSFAEEKTTPMEYGITSGSLTAGGILAAQEFRKEIQDIKDREEKNLFVDHKGRNTREHLPTTRGLKEGDRITIKYLLSDAENVEAQAADYERAIARNKERAREELAKAESLRKNFPSAAGDHYVASAQANMEATRDAESLKKLLAGDHRGVWQRTEMKVIEIPTGKGPEVVEDFLKERLNAGARITVIDHLPGEAWLRMKNIMRKAGAVGVGAAVGVAVGIGAEYYQDAVATDIKKDSEVYVPKRTAAEPKAGTR